MSGERRAGGERHAGAPRYTVGRLIATTFPGQANEGLRKKIRAALRAHTGESYEGALDVIRHTVALTATGRAQLESLEKTLSAPDPRRDWDL